MLRTRSFTATEQELEPQSRAGRGNNWGKARAQDKAGTMAPVRGGAPAANPARAKATSKKPHVAPEVDNIQLRFSKVSLLLQCFRTLWSAFWDTLTVWNRLV